MSEYIEPVVDDWGICLYCGMGIVVRRVHTGRMASGPFWRSTWTHAESGDVKCWTPSASPIKNRREFERIYPEASDVQ